MIISYTDSSFPYYTLFFHIAFGSDYESVIYNRGICVSNTVSFASF